MLSTRAQDRKKRGAGWFTALYSGNLAIVAAGVAVLAVAPLAGAMLSGLAGSGAGRSGALLDGSGYEQGLLETLVGQAFGWLLHGRGKAATGPSGRLAAAGGRAGAGPGDASAWGDAFGSAARGVAKADRSVGLPEPGRELTSRLSELASPAKEEAPPGAVQLSVPSSQGLVKAPEVESNLSRLNGAKDYARAALQTAPGLDASASRSLASLANGRQESAALSGAAGGRADGGNNAVDPQIQKLHEINSKWDAIAKADKAVADAVQSALASAQTTGDAAEAMAPLSAMDAKLAADQAAHLKELEEWSKNASDKLGTQTNALNDDLVRNTLSLFRGARTGINNAFHGPGHPVQPGPPTHHAKGLKIPTNPPTGG